MRREIKFGALRMIYITKEKKGKYTEERGGPSTTDKDQVNRIKRN